MIAQRGYLALLLLLGALTMPGAAALASFPEHVRLDEHTLQRIGVGTARYAGIISVYEAALYAPAPLKRGAILDRDVPKRLEIVYSRSIQREVLAKAAMYTLERQHEPASLAPWRHAIAKLHAAYRDVAPGDRFALSAAPELGLSLEFNGRELVRIDEPEFASLYFGIWLGEAALSDTLRSALLPAY